MSASRPRVIVSGESDEARREFCESLGESVEVIPLGTSGADQAQGILLLGGNSVPLEDLQLCSNGFLNSVPDALVLIDSEDRIVWHNQTFLKMFDGNSSVVDIPFLKAMGNPELLSPDSIAFHPEPGHIVKAIFKTREREFVAIRAIRAYSPTPGSDEKLTTIVIRDVSEEILENQKREAIYRAGIELGDLSPDEVTEMSHEDRTELLKEKILEYSQDILGFDTIEIRVLNPSTKELIPLLEEGMQDVAACRRLYANRDNNGVTGYVAATGESHLCRDTMTDSLYLCGAVDARSSLTVPLVMHEEVLGTFNVESPGTQSFDSKDLEFLEVFGCVVAMAINQLQLLVAEQVVTATESSDRLRREVALPTDDILSSATAILEKYIGHDPDVCEKLQRIVDNTRTIRSHIERVSEEADSSNDDFRSTATRTRPQRAALKGKRILVVDSDEIVLKSAHELLDRQNCTVEAVRSGEEACQMARSHHYDVVLVDIRLPDMNGYECFCGIQDIDDRLPIILMTGFGYDAGHSIVKSRQRGLKAVLYKPFRREQLLTEVEKAVTPPPPHE